MDPPQRWVTLKNFRSRFGASTSWRLSSSTSPCPPGTVSWIWKSESLPYKKRNTGKKRFTKYSFKMSQMGMLTSHANSGQLLLHCLCLAQVTKSVKAKHQHQHLWLISLFKVWRTLDAGLWYCYFVRFGPSLGDKFKITVKYLSTLFQGSWSDVPHRL